MTVAFRSGVGIVVLDRGDRVLAFEGVGRPGAWQFPQGGLEVGEEPEDALWRELAEETGLTSSDVRLVADVPEWLGYELPEESRSAKTGRGQVHKWFFLRVLDPEPPVDVGSGETAEFAAWRWMDIDDVVAGAAAFRRPVYRRLAEVLAQLER